MSNVSALFLKSAFKPDQFPDSSLPEIAFVGRSNVGKSSLINTLTNIKKLAKTSSTPGKTQMINFFKINESLVFADLPGYGFSHAPISIKKNWRVLIESYLKGRSNLKGAIHCLDIRHKPTELDLKMKEWFDHYKTPTILVLTKADKISKGLRNQKIKEISKNLELNDKESLIIFSAKTREGKKDLWKSIMRVAGLGPKTT